MAYSLTIFNSIDEVPLDDWNQICQFDEEIYMDHRFIASVEQTMGDQAKFWTLIIYDDHKRPAAIACIFLWRLDGAILSSPRLANQVRLIRKLWHGCLYLNALVVGLPVSNGQSQLRIRDDADLEEVCRLIDNILKKLSRQYNARILLLKEFTSHEAQQLEKLAKYGYLLKDSLPVNMFERNFRDLADYLGAMRSHYRNPVKRSLRKAEKAGIRFEEVYGNEGISRIYTEEVHDLYNAVFNRANNQFERLPAAFFQEIARRFGEQAVCTFAYYKDTVVAFLISLRTAKVFKMMFIGINYEINRKSDLYFAIMYKHLDCALRQNVSEIDIGQTADDFKLRLGCHQVPRYLYIRGCGFVRPVLKLFSNLFFSRIELIPSKNIWRKDLKPET